MDCNSKRVRDPESVFGIDGFNHPLVVHFFKTLQGKDPEEECLHPYVRFLMVHCTHHRIAKRTAFKLFWQCIFLIGSGKNLKMGRVGHKPVPIFHTQKTN